MIEKHIAPELAKSLKTAGIKLEPDAFIAKYRRFSFILSALITGFCALIVIEGIANPIRNFSPLSLVAIPITFLISYLFFLVLFLNSPNSVIAKRKVDLESDLLYSTRFLLLKIESGSPILNALIDVSNLETKSSRFFKEIVADIYLGTPIEEAIENAEKYSPSRAFSKILEEIKNSLKTGADVEKSLKATLNEMTKNHVILIEEYAKKLSPVSMFYMIIGTILPSLGSAMLVVGSGFINFRMTFFVFLAMLFALALTQGFFIILFRALKPPVMN